MKLPLLDPDPVRATRVRSRCHERLALHRQHRPHRETVAIRVERAIVAGFAAINVAAVALNALRVFGRF